MIFNFHNGRTAKKISQITKSKIKKESQYFFEPIKNIKFNKISIKGNRFLYKKGEDVYLMFAYLENYNTKEYGLPKYHVSQCITRDEFSGYSYTSSMPVEIYCRDQNKTLKEPQHLKLCNNCMTGSFKSFFTFLAKGKPWYEYVLEYARSDNEIANKIKSNGYVLMWKQISEAVRESKDFKCENCNIKLSNDKYYLEVHHKDYNKTNNDIKNLKSLCVLCHATVDKRHLANFKKDAFKVESFIDSYTEYIKQKNQSNLLKWESH